MDWKNHWQGMPEFYQEDKTPFKVLKVKIATKEDFIAFQKAIGQTISDKAKSVWFPKLQYEKPSNFEYVDEE